MEGGRRIRISGQNSSRWYRDLKVGDLYHPALAWGMLIVFFCILGMFILAITGVVPQPLTPFFVALLLAIIILGAVLLCVGTAKSYERGAFPILIAIFLLEFIMFVIWAIMQG